MRHVLEHDLNIQNVSEKSRQCILATLLAHKNDNKHVLIHFMCARVFSRFWKARRPWGGGCKTIRLKKN